MRRMYDSVDAAAVPADGDLYAGYLDGSWQTYTPLRARFPDKLIVSIAAFASTRGAQVYDVEEGDLYPGDVVPVLLRERAAGNWPSFYVNRANWPVVTNLVNSAGLAQPPYWLARPGPAELQTGTVATQHYYPGPYDQSVVADNWPGIDPPPTTTEDVTVTPACQIRAWILEYWGREPTVVEQQSGEWVLATKGDDLTLASIYDNPVAQAFRKARGW